MTAAGAAFVVGHAFGNRVARMLATDRPELVRAVALVAANVGHAPSPPEVRAAIRASADPSLPDAERLAALQFAFFAPGNDARAVARRLASRRAGGAAHRRRPHLARGGLRRRRPPRSSTCSRIMIRSPMRRTPHEFKQALGERVTIVVVRNCSHAAVAEAPDAISDALIDYAPRLWPKS